MNINERTGQKGLECPWWCTSNHQAAMHVDEEQRYRIRGHYGLQRDLQLIDEFGRDQTASVALVSVDDLANGSRGPAGITALCEGVMTPEQTELFATMLQQQATEARKANSDAVRTPAELREVTR